MARCVTEMNKPKDIQNSLWKSKAIMWSCSIFFMFCFAMSLHSVEIGVSSCFIFLIVPCALWLGIYGRISANQKEMKLYSFFGIYSINWEILGELKNEPYN